MRSDSDQRRLAQFEVLQNPECLLAVRQELRCFRCHMLQLGARTLFATSPHEYRRLSAGVTGNRDYHEGQRSNLNMGILPDSLFPSF